MNRPAQIDTATARPAQHIDLSLAVLGITVDRELTEECQRRLNRLAGDKVRLASAIEAGSIAKHRALDLMERLQWAVDNSSLNVLNGSAPQLDTISGFLRDYGRAVDAACRTAEFVRRDLEHPHFQENHNV